MARAARLDMPSKTMIAVLILSALFTGVGCAQDDAAREAQGDTSSAQRRAAEDATDEEGEEAEAAATADTVSEGKKPQRVLERGDECDLGADSECPAGTKCIYEAGYTNRSYCARPGEIGSAIKQ